MPAKTLCEADRESPLPVTTLTMSASMGGSYNLLTTFKPALTDTRQDTYSISGTDTWSWVRVPYVPNTTPGDGEFMLIMSGCCCYCHWSLKSGDPEWGAFGTIPRKNLSVHVDWESLFEPSGEDDTGSDDIDVLAAVGPFDIRFDSGPCSVVNGTPVPETDAKIDMQLLGPPAPGGWPGDSDFLFFTNGPAFPAGETTSGEFNATNNNGTVTTTEDDVPVSMQVFVTMTGCDSTQHYEASATVTGEIDFENDEQTSVGNFSFTFSVTLDLS